MLRALEDAMVPQFLGVSRHQRESGSSLAVEGLLGRIVEVESLVQWLQSLLALCFVPEIIACIP